MSRTRGLRSRRTEAAASLAVASALVLLAGGCFGGGGGKSKAQTGTTESGTLPSGGMRKTFHTNGSTLVAVVYGGSGEIGSAKFTVKPKAGNHFTAVKMGFENDGPQTYHADLTKLVSIVNDQGQTFGGVALGKKGEGLETLTLKEGETAYGRVYSQIRDNTRLQSVRFRPSPGAKAAEYVLRGSSGEPSTKPLPSGGIVKVLKGATKGQMIKAVVYGGSSVGEKALPNKPLPGNHFVSVKMGIKNFGSKPYAVNILPSTSVTNSDDKISRAVSAPGHGLIRVSLTHGQTAYGRVFFQIADGTRLRTVRFRPYGPKTKVYSFVIRG